MIKTFATIVVAYSDNKVIGLNGSIPWHISDDLKRFKKITIGNTVIMGRKTFESIGFPLKERTNIVITNQSFYSPGLTKSASENKDTKLEMAYNIEDAMNKAQIHKKKIFIIGGESIYKQYIDNNLVDSILVTEVHRYVKGDTHFPQIKYNKWDEVSRDLHINNPSYSFVEYKKRD